MKVSVSLLLLGTISQVSALAAAEGGEDVAHFSNYRLGHVGYEKRDFTPPVGAGFISIEMAEKLERDGPMGSERLDRLRMAKGGLGPIQSIPHQVKAPCHRPQFLSKSLSQHLQNIRQMADQKGHGWVVRVKQKFHMVFIGRPNKNIVTPGQPTILPFEQEPPKVWHISSVMKEHIDTFEERFDKFYEALLRLGFWESTAVAFVFGCGLGVLLRMIFVFCVLASRSIARPEQQYILIEETEDIEQEVAMPSPEKI